MVHTRRATEVTMMVGMVFKMRKAIRHISEFRFITQEIPISVQHNSNDYFFKLLFMFIIRVGKIVLARKLMHSLPI